MRRRVHGLHKTQDSAGTGVGQWWPQGDKTLNQRLRTCARAQKIAHRLPHPVEISSESLIAASIAGALGVTSYRGHGFRNQSAVWRSVESPGRHFTSAETYEHQQFNQAFNAVYGWADRVNEEIVLQAKTHSDNSMIEEMRRNVAETADNLPEPDKPFSAEELEDWSTQLKRLVARLMELERQNEIQAGRVENLGRELENLKKQGASLPKRTWLKTAGNKVLDLLDSTSKAALKALAEGAVKALLDHKP